MDKFLTYAIPGIPYGCDFALMAVGLVLTFAATGVFNLGFGAQAFVIAIVFDLLVKTDHLPTGLAFVVAVFVVAPGIGWMLDRFLFRHIKTASSTAKVVVSLALLVALPEAIPIIFGRAPRDDPAVFSFWPHPRAVHLHLLGSNLNGSQLTITVMTVGAVLVLLAVLHFTPLGLQMRAVVESRRLAELEGIDSGAISSYAWVVSSILAGVAGVMMIPLAGTQLDPADPLSFTTLLVAAVTAAALAGMRSLPIALAGGVGLGILQFLLTGYLPPGRPFTHDIVASLPFALLAAVLLANPRLRHVEEGTDPLSSVDPPDPPPARAVADPRLAATMRVGWRGLLVVYVFSVLVWVPGVWVTALTEGMVLSVVFLSITLVTGMGGQLSLCQATFAGIGAFTAGQLALHHNVPVLGGAMIGALIAAGAGALVALLALRVSGLVLTLATLAFALFADNVLFQFPWSGGSLVQVYRPVLGPVNFSDDRSFFVLVLCVLVLSAGLVALLQRGSTGRLLAAMRASPVGAAGIGVDLRRLKLMVFVTSAGIAAFGGAMFAMQYQRASQTDWVYEASLAFAVVVVTTGSRTIEGAINAGMAFAVLSTLQTLYLPERLGGIVIILFALGATTYARHPEGIVEYQKTRAIGWVSDRLRTWIGEPRDAGGGGERSESAAMPGPAPEGSGA